MKKFYMSAAIIVGGLSFLQTPLGAIVREQPTGTVQGENVLIRVRSPREPVEITSLQLWENNIVFGTPFTGDESWVGALSARVKNTSAKVVTELRMSINFEASGANPPRIAIPLTYSGPIQPNQTVQVSAPTASVASLRIALAKQGLLANFRKGEVLTQYAKFADGSLWVRGVILGPRDPRTGRRKRM